MVDFARPNIISQVTPMPMAVQLVQGSLEYEVGVLSTQSLCSAHHYANHLEITVGPYIRK
jgi:hypothetical protein